MSIFAELEKAMDKWKERIEKVREKRVEEKKDAAKREDVKRRKSVSTKKTTIQASSAEDLFKKVNEIDWSNVKKVETDERNRFDVSI